MKTTRLVGLVLLIRREEGFNFRLGNAEELDVKYFFESSKASKLETMLHNHFAEKKILNEWYSLSKEDVDSFLDTCKFYENNIKALSENPFF